MNPYEVLGVSETATDEQVRSAYIKLVKKYHPDLQDNNLKAEYEEKIKLINEAFEVLSDSEKRKNYDLNLKQTEFSVEDYNNLINENLKLKNEINYLKNNLINYKNNINSILENVFALFLTVFIFIFIFFILFCIPYTRNFLINFFNFSYFKHIL